ncbi:MFS transporter [Microbacterium sp. MPKO10]|uniref:MFS transporter n=1 Tax=Microbacterium sp. MPKO10 TaxID=2989818 RepID=UPI0022366939|nr:MFS transporter [Microbacterium sp. MPKO10]MCW4456668.1 MFS transporter [Microbacterium sp. MPKO10]
MTGGETVDENHGAIGILKRRYRWVTTGTVALVFFSAFESLAITTVMPVVSADLGGDALYALAFAGPLATGIIGMVGAGSWADRRGPVLSLYASVTLFTIGLLVAGVAGSMAVFVLGRLLQGFGGGGLTVAVYVVVARVFPAELHPRIFAAFAAAWVVPSLVGPFVAGAVAEIFSWHWVFLGVVALVCLALSMVIPALRSLDRPRVETTPIPWARLGFAGLAAGGVLGVSLLGTAPVIGWFLATGFGALAIASATRLMPRGALRAARGLPAVISLRGLASAAFIGAEVYVPYLLTREFGFSPSIAGLALTLAALSWSGGSVVQGRIGSRVPSVVFARVGTLLIVTSMAVACITAALHLPPLLIIIGWAVGGAGMGLVYPRSSVLVLAYSTVREQGFNSSAISIADSLGGALSLALTGLVFAVFTSGAMAFAAVFALTAAVAVGAACAAPRVAASVDESSHLTPDIG